MNCLRPALLCLLFGLGAARAQTAAPPPFASEANLRFVAGVGPEVKLKFRDTQGKPMTEDAFFARLRAGDGLGLSGSHRTGSVYFTLDPSPGKPPAAKPRIAVGATLPPMVDGKPNVFSKDINVVSFFFVACGACADEFPVLNAFHAERPDIGAVAVTYDAAEDAAALAKETGFTWPIIGDAVPFYRKVSIELFPTIALVNRKGTIIAITEPYRLHAKGHALTPDDISRWIASTPAR